jgi:hypothetical protein
MPDITGFTGERTSDAAALRGNAGPDGAAADTDGIADAGQVRSGIGLTRGLGEEKCCRNRPTRSGNSGNLLVRKADRRECSF